MKFIRYLLVSLFLMLPAFASADTIIKPPGKDTWEMHVMGNGPVIASVLESVKLIIAPDGGGSGFRSLLLFIALLGFCILAVQAGFNPGANLFKMFGYLFVVWVVTLTTTQLKTNILVIDPVTRTETFVAKVPAVVGLPAAVVSGIGHYLTTTIEQAYSTPGQELSLTGAGFDIFGKVQSDLDQYTISQPELRQSMSAYIGDCTVPAIARQRLTASELYQSRNLMDTLEKASSGTTLTRYYTANAASSAASTTFGVDSNIMSCSEAYGKLKDDMTSHAQQMMDAGTKEWTKSGVMVGFETVLQTFMEKANTGTGANGGSYGRPTGMITQKALINTMSGDFRQAAVQTGNNELLMGVQVSQAEQSQKSGWVTSAAVFKNMMGYVYTTLQAFIYAITPIVVIALMVPGLGKKIFVNYGQILVWLTLWEPMLSIVNYLVTLFRMEGLANATASSGGITMLNTWTTSEAANNMVIASSFLGTMVPILAWGLVTGAMAFNDFISQGIGSSFAMTAGANAATGAANLNSMSMNKLDANKFDNAEKSTVGYQSVMAHEGAGALTSSLDHGGKIESVNGSAISAQGQLSQANQKANAVADSTTIQKTAGTSAQAGSDARATQDTSKKNEAGEVHERGHQEQSGQSASQGTSAGTDKSSSHGTKIADSATTGESRVVTAAISSGVGLDAKGGGGGAGGKPPGAAAGAAGGIKGGAGAKAGANLQSQQATKNEANNTLSKDTSYGDSTKSGTSVSAGTSAGVTDSSGVRGSLSSTTTNSSGSSRGASVSTGASLGTSSSTSTQASSTATHTESSQHNFGAALDRSSEDYDRIRSQTESDVVADPGMVARSYQTSSAAAAEMSSVANTFAEKSAALESAGGHSALAMPNVAGGADLSLLHSAPSQIAGVAQGLTQGATSTNAAVTSAMGTGLTNASSMFGEVNGLTMGGDGGFKLTSGGADGKMAALGVGAVGTALSTLSSNAVTSSLLGRGALGAAAAATPSAGAAAGGGALATAGGITAGGLALGTVAVGGAFAGGWYIGEQINDYVGRDNMARYLEPVFKGIDSGIDAVQTAGNVFSANKAATPPWAAIR
jgi:hypothetical protein